MKRKTHFHFKQFSMRHDQCTMKVGTDAVLLGSWVKVLPGGSILDIGTGSGVIALMLAQRTPRAVRIDAVEIEERDAGQAGTNFIQSPWPDRLSIHHVPIQSFFPAERYDIIVTNPPYFINSHRPPDGRRFTTRHTVSLDHPTLIAVVLRLLKESGSFNVILPDTEGRLFIQLAACSGLFCSRKYAFRTRSNKPVERWLLEFQRKETTSDTGEVLLYDQGLQWSQDYISLTGEFYLSI